MQPMSPPDSLLQKGITTAHPTTRSPARARVMRPLSGRAQVSRVVRRIFPADIRRADGSSRYSARTMDSSSE